MDLTSLNENETESSIIELCQKSMTPFGDVAAVCLYPKWIATAKSLLENTPIKIATVVNFPSGNESIDLVVSTIQEAIKRGAQEIDVVFPYSKYLTGEHEAAKKFIQCCRASCGEKVLLKVILETGILKDLQIIAEASRDAILAGADFLKTSTGKIAIGANPVVATQMLITIKKVTKEVHRTIGFKASGGIRTIEDANQYINLATEIMGSNWITPETFRLGASHLLDKILEDLGNG